MKQFSYMLHTIFHYAPGESAAYLAAEIMSCLISFLQLILLQSVVDSFFTEQPWQWNLARRFVPGNLFSFSGVDSERKRAAAVWS